MAGKRLISWIITIACFACAFVWFGMQHINLPNIDERFYSQEEFVNDAALVYEDMAKLALKRGDKTAAYMHCQSGLRCSPKSQTLIKLLANLSNDQLSQSAYES